MDGFADGVAKYNETKGKDVKVLGWDKAKQDGSFTGNFDNQDDGKKLAQNLIDEGADIIMPVAGPVGLGAAAAQGQGGGKDVKIIGVDADGFVTAPEYRHLPDLGR